MHPPSEIAGYSPIYATDAVQYTEQMRGWNFEFTQLNPGEFTAAGGIVEFSGLSVARVSVSDSLLHRGYAPADMAAVFVPGIDSGAMFSHGQRVQSGQCVTLANGGFAEAVTHGPSLNVAVGFDVNACGARLEALNGGGFEMAPGARIVSPGTSWIVELLARVESLLTSVPDGAGAPRIEQLRACFADQVLAAVVRFERSAGGGESGARSSCEGRRSAVRRARDLIHARLSEPLRLSELCRHANLKVRSLEYGFREVTGLTPIAYIRSLRLNAARRALHRANTPSARSITEIAMDLGFWHLGQFATDYRLFFGETPTETRRRGLARTS